MFLKKNTPTLKKSEFFYEFRNFVPCAKITWANFDVILKRLFSEVQFSFLTFVCYLECLTSFLRKPVNPNLSRHNALE